MTGTAAPGRRIHRACATGTTVIGARLVPRRYPSAQRRCRRPYQITAAGQEILAEQVTTMQQIVQVARLRTAMAWGA